ncbi:prolyl 4-hydroxylase-like [Raphidocelis subcapitata]|uniref:procollagen-proline 4-dioxygenase n=1 Tax=Raphidocelis subcapitata TaxID=307507 RepID=A0A2V0P4J8_9CHLO|nr:prolyl 4-hydroxylase-like [Raphidocelis subcapitata]|eukprot:GBF94788.1 prolyl 4-hydroxylase-like [Raphidocelis subcapitata]
MRPARPHGRAAAGLLVLAALLACAPARSSAAAPTGDERFIGWSGETYRPVNPLEKEAKDHSRRWIETISWRPRAYIFHNFLSQNEADYVVKLVEKKVTRSHVVDVKTGVNKMDEIRTSWGGAIDRGVDPVISAIENRIAEWTHLPPENQEPIQVLRYNDGQKYDAHWDWFDDPVHTPGNTTDNRAATVLMYLGEVEEGGETALPIAVPLDAARQGRIKPHLSKCGANGTLAVVPRKGDALLFWDMLPDGKTICRRSLHASCPTLKGTKWTATKWIHNKPYGIDGYNPLRLAARCADQLPECGALAAGGACDARPAEMLGLLGKCRRACQDCVDCAENDLVCLRGNMRSRRRRRQAGYA